MITKLISLVLICTPPTMAAEILTLNPEQVLAFMKEGEKTEFVLVSGTRGQGRVAGVAGSALLIDVKNSVNLSDLPKGRQVVPIVRIASFVVKRCQGNRRKALPTILLSVVGPVTGVIAASRKELSAPVGGAIVGAVGIGGYFVGRASDCQNINVRVEGAPTGDDRTPADLREDSCPD